MALASWFALSLSALIAPPARGPDVVWIDLAQVPLLAQQSAVREAAALLAGVGITQRWRPGGADRAVNEGELAVVLLREDMAGRGRATRVLGACSRRPQARVWVYLENLAWAVGATDFDRLRPNEAALIGRAIGRIVAHEVIHAVAPALEHARSGLMAASFNRSHLLANRLDMDAASLRWLRLALALRASLTPRTS